METVTFKTKKGIERMSVDEFTRWLCLMEAFHFIGEKAKELKLDIGDCIKPLAIENYMKERFPSIRHDVGYELNLGLL